MCNFTDIWRKVEDDTRYLSHHKIYCRKRSLRNTVNTKVTVISTMCLKKHATQDTLWLHCNHTRTWKWNTVSRKRRRDIQVVFCASIIIEEEHMLIHLFLHHLLYTYRVCVVVCVSTNQPTNNDYSDIEGNNFCLEHHGFSKLIGNRDCVFVFSKKDFVAFVLGRQVLLQQHPLLDNTPSSESHSIPTFSCNMCFILVLNAHFIRIMCQWRKQSCKLSKTFETAFLCNCKQCTIQIIL